MATTQIIVYLALVVFVAHFGNAFSQTAREVTQSIGINNDDNSTAPSTHPFSTIGYIPLNDMDDANSSLSKIPLYIGGFFSLSGLWDGSGVLVAVEMALDHINERQDILQEYDLRMVWNDTQCYSGLGSRAFIDQLFNKPQKIILLGPPCSNDAQPVAEIAHYWNLITVAYSTGSPALSDRNKYPYFYRTCTPELSFNPPIIRLMREYGWKRVATIHQNHELFSLAIENFLSLADAANYTIVTTETIGKDPRVSVTNVELHDAKIIFVTMYKDMARLILCEAYKRGMTGSGYVWIMYGWYDAFWWREEDNEVECTVEELDEAILSATIFTIDRSNMSPSENPTIAGVSPPELDTELRERLLWPEYRHYTYSEYAPNGYDATWSIALMLNKSYDVLQTKVFANGERRRLEDFTYGDSQMASLFFNLLNETDFIGMSGNIIFKGGDLWGDSKIGQMQGYEQREVGVYSIAGDRLEWKADVIWKGGYIPIDHTAIIREYQGINWQLFLIISALAGIGLCVAGFFLGFNIKYRTQRNVKMSSPYLNNVIIVGSILIYASVIVGGLDSNLISIKTFEIACQVRTWLLSTGFVLGFGSMFSKTWRVYRVAAQKTPKRRVITDSQLFTMVFVFFGIDVSVLMLWQIADPLHIEASNIYERETDIVNQRIIPYIEQCTSEKIIYWHVALYGYKGLLLLFGTFLAWETRKVTIPALNDSKLIGICVYNTVVLCIVGVSVSFLISDNTAALYTFTSCIIIFCATLTLVVLFIPKVVSVYKFPTGEPTISTMAGRATSNSNEGQSIDKPFSDENQKLRNHINELESQLKAGKFSFTSNTEKLHHSGCGIWCYSMVCGCCSSISSNDGNTDNKNNGIDNHAAVLSELDMNAISIT